MNKKKFKEMIDMFINSGDYDSLCDFARDYQDANDEDITKLVIDSYHLCMKQNIPESYLNLGTMYYSGLRVKQDYQEAFRLYTIAANMGEIRAMCYLGYCYFYGRHGQQDYKKAFEWFSLGALIKSDSNCLYKLGDMYQHGYFVDKNENFAFILYAKSEENLDEEKDEDIIGDINLRLGNALLYGIGTNKDVQLAYLKLTTALSYFYLRRSNDPFVVQLINHTKDLIKKAEEILDSEIISIDNA